MTSCDATIKDWTILIITLLTTHLTWLLLPLPTFWREGGKPYFSHLTWHTLRLHLPTRVFLPAILRGPREHWESRYYHGLNDVTTWKGRVVNVVVDVLVFVGVGMAFYVLLNDGAGGFDINVSLWMYPSLPNSVLGLWITAVSKTKLPPKVVVGGGLFILFAVPAPIAYLIHTFYPTRLLWLLPTASYIFVSFFPLLVLAINKGWLRWVVLLLVMMGTMLARVGAPVYASLTEDGWFPYCQLANGKVFAIVLLGLGCVAMLAAVWRHCYCEVRELREKLKEAEIGGRF
jgi:hypothetical protein